MAPHRKDALIPLLTVLSDIVAIEGAFLFSYWLRFYSPLTDLFPVELGFPPLEAYVYGSFFVIPFWLFLFQTRKMYATRRTIHFSDEFFPIVRVVVVGMLVVMAAAFFYRAFSFSRLVFGLLAVSSVAFLSLGRFAVLKVEQLRYRRGRDIKQVIIVGANDTAKRIFQAMMSQPSLGYRVIGYFTSGAKQVLKVPGAKRLGSIAAVPKYLKDHSVDLVLIALSNSEHSKLFDLVRDCQGLSAEMMMAPDMIELMTSRMRIEEIEGVPFIQVREASLSVWNRILKRAFDVAFALVVLILASPLLLILILLIKATSPGPIFFLQERVGLDGTLFRVIKFRTMPTDAEKETGPVWAAKNDPRTTSIGKILRRYSLDELPQLFNVLLGEMSIVGPRPERPYFVERFKVKIPKYLDRHRVKTGMTGWAQVNGLRGNAPIEERTKYDVYYMENWSLIFDLKIILKTVRAVLFGKDAY
ncbi:MAG TPA: undecaprenyl-phosphate glucose phosphotransferase [Bacteroidota bacterium]|nr:undecaprenyl-phosphate glucose phosphotransferase [Bacteroidota bacterium]